MWVCMLLTRGKHVHQILYVNYTVLSIDHAKIVARVVPYGFQHGQDFLTAVLYILILVVYYIDTRNLQHTPSYQVDIPFTANNICIPSYHWHCIYSGPRGVFYCPSELPSCIIYFHRIYHSEIVQATRNDKGYLYIRVITKLPNSEQSYKGKVKTHKYINRQNQSTTGKL